MVRVSGSQLNKVKKTLKNYDLVIIGYHTSNKHPWKSFKFSKRLALVGRNRKKQQGYSIRFASPYSLLDVNSFANIEGILIGYQNSKIAQEIGAQVIFGAISANGKLPVSIKEEFPVGTGLTTQNLMRLQYTIPETVGMSSQKLAKIDSVATVVLKEKMAPGLQILVARHGQVIYEKSFGFHTDQKKNPVRNSDVYDIASLTKILSSLPLLIKAEEEQKNSSGCKFGEDITKAK